MDVSAFYAIVSAINFTLLGLWWVAVKERPDIGGPDAARRWMAYLVSLGFVIPGTVSLLAQVAPDEPVLWRASFAFAGVAGAVGTAMLGRALRDLTGEGLLVRLLWWVAVPIYLLVAVVAAIPGVPEALNLRLSSIEVEGFLLTLLVFLGVQAAWVVAMTPEGADESAIT
ncbi:MAG TPA: hypothetical protein VJ644_12065 [Jiangellaceae bacterium]|nr:hypothetical protein [Jiangellaceae bacterium]